MGESGLQVLGRDLVKANIFLERALPHPVPLDRLPVLRLVPDLPMRDLHAVAVSPALRIVADHVLTDARPFREVLRRIDAVGADGVGVLNRDAKPEIRLNAILLQRLHQQIRKGEIIVLRLCLICIKVPEDVRDVNVDVLAERSSDVMQSRIRNARLLKIIKQAVAIIAKNRRLPDPIDRLDHSSRCVKVDLYGCRRTERKGNCKRQKKNPHQTHQYLSDERKRIGWTPNILNR